MHFRAEVDQCTPCKIRRSCNNDEVASTTKESIRHGYDEKCEALEAELKKYMDLYKKSVDEW